MVSSNVNQQHQENLRFQDRLALKITNSIGTMYCFYVFCGIGVGSLIGVITGNVFLALLFGAVSSYFIQLVLLPLLMVGQKLQQQHAELRAEEDYKVNLSTEAAMLGVRSDLILIKDHLGL